jgi:hypothetical protein
MIFVLVISYRLEAFSNELLSLGDANLMRLVDGSGTHSSSPRASLLNSINGRPSKN